LDNYSISSIAESVGATINADVSEEIADIALKKLRTVILVSIL